MMQWRVKRNKGTQMENVKPVLEHSIEFINHFRCGHCNKWFSIADCIVKSDRPVACPHCHSVFGADERSPVQVPNMKMLEWLAELLVEGSETRGR